MAKNRSMGMSAEQIIALGQQMRAKQKEYFQTRDKEVLRDCKRLETNYDRATAAFLDNKDMFHG